MNISTVFSALLSATLITGCASIVSQSSWPVAINSSPETTTFSVTNEKGDKIQTGTTPSIVSLASGAGYFDGATYSLHFEKDGFEDKTETLDSSLNGWYWGNFLFGGLIGLLIVDPNTGAMYKLPENFSTNLTAKIKSSSISKHNDRMNYIKELKDKGIITQEEYDAKRKEILKDL